MKKIAIIALCLLLILSSFGCGTEKQTPNAGGTPEATAPQAQPTPEPAAVPADGAYVVGEHIPFGDVTDFYYTVYATTFPPHYQRYRFFVEEGAYKFFHETREGDHLPLTEEDATVFGTITLTGEQWNAFLGCIAGGTAIARQEHLESGDDGPWLYLYWTGDPGDVQEFAFASMNARSSFEALCESLSDAG